MSGDTASRLRELVLIFLRLGATAFGGPAAHVALMEDEFVRRRGWLSRQQFLDLVAATNLLPGPNSTELAMHVGHRRAGLAGLIVAGTAFILPAAVLVGVLAAVYVRTRHLPAVEAVLYGIKPAVVALVARALLALARSLGRDPIRWAIAIVAVASAAAGVHELAVLALGGTAALAIRWGAWAKRRRSLPARLILPPAGAPALKAAGTAALTLAAAPGGPGVLPLALIFLKIGAVLYGSGYVLVAFLRADFVTRTGWLDADALLDAVAAGQVTPGPVFTTATFVGYLLAGVPGAAAATAGIFSPAFVFSALSAGLVPRLRRSPAAGAVLDGVAAASLGLMAVATAQLGRAAVVDVPTAVLAAATLALAARTRIHPTWLIVVGAALGLVRRALLA